MLNDQLLAVYWSELPIGKENAVDYPQLCNMWGRSARKVRIILHELSHYDNGDDYILIRSSKSKGFYKTDDKEEISAYRKECLNKGRSIFAPVRKCNRILKADATQFQFFNNFRVVRESVGLKQRAVCDTMKQYDRAFDVSLLSKIENGVCLPTPYQLSRLAEIYGVEPRELVGEELPTLELFGAI